jgi:hypothetical protein
MVRAARREVRAGTDVFVRRGIQARIPAVSFNAPTDTENELGTREYPKNHAHYARFQLFNLFATLTFV